MRQQLPGLRDLRMPRQIAGRGHQHIADGLERPRHQPRRDLARHADAQAQVQPLGHQVHHAVRHVHLHLHLGPARAKTRQQWRQPEIAQHGRRADLQQPARLLAQLTGQRLHGLGIRHQPQAGLVDLGPRLGQRQRARGALQQPQPEMRLQPPHAAAHGRSRQPQLPGRARKALVLHHAGEDQHFIQRHGGFGQGTIPVFVAWQAILI